MEFVREVKQTGLRAELVTNGVLLDRRAAETLLELQLDKLAVSLDGLTPQPEEPFHVEAATLVHDHLRLFHQLKQARRSQRPDITLVFVASRRNIDQLPRLQQAAQEFGATNILVTNLLPPTRELNDDVLYQQWATTRRTAPQAPWNPAIDLPRMDLSSASQVIERLGTAGNHVRLGGATVSGGRMYCRFVHEGCVAVSPVGDVSPCLPLLHSHRYFFRHEERRILAYHPGNINRASLQDIWDSDHFRAFRERVRRFEFSPTCCSRRSPCVDRLLSSSWLCSPAPVRPTARQAT
jgi:MoaA/NifB/PqqE/SkfB family radical SAM enzyme